MSLSLFLAVLIGLISTWFLLSIATLNIQEWMASRFKWRACMLEKTLAKLFTDDIILDQFYNHPLIRSLFTGKDGQDKPSYIPASQFSQAVIDILATTGTEASLLQNQLYYLQSEAKKLTPRKRKTALHRINLLLGMTRKALVSESGEDAVSTIIETAKNELISLQNNIPEFQEKVEGAFASIRTQKQDVNDALIKLAYPDTVSNDGTVNKIRAGTIALSITHPQLKQTLYAILHTVPQSIWQSENELELIRANIEEWFNSSMTRLTGWYKRRTLVNTFMISLLIALCGNIDSINIADRIWHEPELRAVVMDQISDLLLQADGAGTGSTEWLLIQEQVNASGIPVGWVGNLASLDENLLASPVGLDARNCTIFPTAEDQIYGFWINQRCYQIINAPLPMDAAGWSVKGLGILLTTIAASQGAPFWFDLLKKIVNVRLSGVNPSETTRVYG